MVHCAVTDLLVLFELVKSPQPRIVPRAITMMIFLLPRRPTQLRRMSLSYAPVAIKKKRQRQGTRYGKIAKEDCYRRDSVTIAIRVDRRGGSSPARVTFGQILQKKVRRLRVTIVNGSMVSGVGEPCRQAILFSICWRCAMDDSLGGGNGNSSAMVFGRGQGSS